MADFSCEVCKDGDSTRITVRGELDPEACRSVIDTVTPWMTPEAHVIVDCSGITCADPGVLLGMTELRRIAAETGAVLTFVAMPPAVSRVFELS